MTHDTHTTENATRRWQVCDFNREWLIERIAQINRRAKRIGVEPIVLVEGEPYEAVVKFDRDSDERTMIPTGTPEADEYIAWCEARRTKAYTFVIRDCYVEGETPRIADWDFVGAIQHLGDAGNLTRLAPAFTTLSLPRRFHTSGPEECDHCNARRQRKETYILHNVVTDEWKQVGSTCLRDFTGHDPKRAMGLASMLFDIEDAFKDAGDHEFGGMRAPTTLPLDEFLAWTSKSIRENGWLSRGAAYEQGRYDATADCASSMYWQYHSPSIPAKDKPEPPTEADFAQANEVIAWGQGELAEKFDTLNNDYLLNLAVIFRSDFVTTKGMGLAASAVKAWERAMNRKARDESERSKWGTSEHVGTIGKRMMFDRLTLTHIYTTEGMYGLTTILTFRTDAGCIVKWFATGAAGTGFKQGESYKGKATVKKHGEWKNVKETVVNRAALTRIED